MDAVGSVLVVIGAIVSVLAAWGMVDFPTALSRMQAATKPASLGLASIVLGAGIAASSWGLVGLAALVSVFLFVTTPISGHMLGRAAYHAGQGTGLVHDDLAGRWADPEPEEPTSRRIGWWRVVSLAAVWVVLWRDIALGTVVAGIGVGMLVEVAVAGRSHAGRVSIAGSLRFLVAYAGLVIWSTARVAWEVLTPTNDQIREAVVEVPLRVREVGARVLLANALSYTPGTLTIDLWSDRVFVHVLHFEDVETTVAEVRRVEDLVLGAMPMAEA